MQLFFFVNYLKEKLVLFVQKISGEGQCTQKDNAKRWSFMLGSEVWRQNKKKHSRRDNEETSKWKSFTGDEVDFKLRQTFHEVSI